MQERYIPEYVTVSQYQGESFKIVEFDKDYNNAEKFVEETMIFNPDYASLDKDLVLLGITSYFKTELPDIYLPWGQKKLHYLKSPLSPSIQETFANETRFDTLYVYQGIVEAEMQSEIKGYITE